MMQTDRDVIENHAKVYLRREPGGAWTVDPVTLDGYELDGAEEGDYDDYFDVKPDDVIDGEIPGSVILAGRADWNTEPLPTGRELLDLMAAALGLVVTEEGDR